MTNQLANATIQIQDLYNGMITDAAEFKNKLNTEVTAQVNTNVKNAETNLKANMNIYLPVHTTTLHGTLTQFIPRTPHGKGLHEDRTYGGD